MKSLHAIAAIGALSGSLPYAHAQHTVAMPPRHDRNFTTCMVCGATKTPDQQFCSRECCAEYKITGAKYSPFGDDLAERRAKSMAYVASMVELSQLAHQ
jgi:hypothetical protein